MFELRYTTQTQYGVNGGTFATYQEAEDESKRLWFAPWSDVVATWVIGDDPRCQRKEG